MEYCSLLVLGGTARMVEGMCRDGNGRDSAVIKEYLVSKR